MHAVAVYPNARKIEVIDTHPEPALERDTDVLLDMLDVGVCGTDKEIARFDYGTPPPGVDYLVHRPRVAAARSSRVGTRRHAGEDRATSS